jgi:hypothetical protein
LIAFEFRTFQAGGVHDDAALGVDFFRHHEALRLGMGEQLLQHLDHVFVGVIVVVPQYDVVGWLLPDFLLVLLLVPGLYAGQRDGVAHGKLLVKPQAAYFYSFPGSAWERATREALPRRD